LAGALPWRVASFGFRYDYTLRRHVDAEPIPSWLGPLIEQVEAFSGLHTRIQQVLCTEYDVGVGNGWHRDKPQFVMTGPSRQHSIPAVEAPRYSITLRTLVVD